MPSLEKPPISPGARSDNSGMASHAAAASLWSSRTRSDSREISPGTDPRDAGSTSIAVTSGAAAWIAPSTASCNVTVEEGQLSQVPSNRSVTTPASSIPNSSTSPPWEPKYGRTLSKAAATRVVTS
jgi:hypothetical protein